MNKFTKEIANILQAQIDNQPYDSQQSGLTLEQVEEITKFAGGYSRIRLHSIPIKSTIRFLIKYYQ